MAGRNENSAYTLVFAACLPLLQSVAREHGYALAVHGSMATDLDLVAVPWTEEASDGITLVQAIQEATGAQPRTDRDLHCPEWKFHGRLAWCLYLGPVEPGKAPYIDISVMPKRRPGEHYEHDGKLLPIPSGDQALQCIVCCKKREWGIFDPKTGTAVCKQCRDAARSRTSEND